jgi:hypothetical protein
MSIQGPWRATFCCNPKSHNVVRRQKMLPATVCARVGRLVTPAALKSKGMVMQMPDHPLGFCQNALCLNELLKRDEQEDGLARA